MTQYLRSLAKGSLKVFGILVLTYVLTISPTISNAQVRLAAMAGIVQTENGSTKLAGVLNAGYEYRGFGLLYDQRHTVTSGPGWFGGNVGYAVKVGNISVRPYAGYWHLVYGDNFDGDRYIHGGTEQTLSKYKKVNTAQAGYGIQVFKGKFLVDVGYHGVFSFSIGMGGLLTRR